LCIQWHRLNAQEGRSFLALSTVLTGPFIVFTENEV
jgi:hypothetical protein